MAYLHVDGDDLIEKNNFMMQIEEITGIVSLNRWNGTRWRKQWVYGHVCRKVNEYMCKGREARHCFENDSYFGRCSILKSLVSIQKPGDTIKVKVTDALEGYWWNLCWVKGRILCEVLLRPIWFQNLCSFSAMFHLWVEVGLWISVPRKHYLYSNVYNCWPFGFNLELKCVFAEVGGWLGDLWPFPCRSSLAWKVRAWCTF